MSEFFHSVTLDKDECKGCINCIKRCPTEAIRVRDGKANIIIERCIDCGECIRVCPHHAKKAITDPLSIVNDYPYKVALMAPSFFGQFNNLEDPELVIAALQDIGFDAVFDVGRAAELLSDATRKLLDEGKLPKPVISSACPAVLRLIRVRFPSLIPRLLPLIAPVELAARMSKDEAEAGGIPRDQVGCIFLTPCPAKVTAIRMPIGTGPSEIDGAVAIKDIYPLLLPAMKKAHNTEPPQSGRIGLGWAESGGEAAGLLSTDAYLAADGIENVIRVLEDLEDDKFQDLEFVELDACAGGCVGGVLQVENPYIAKAKIKKLRRYMPVSLNHLGNSWPSCLTWNTDLEYEPVMELGKTTEESFDKYAILEETLQQLPMLDCGSCGAPTCEAFAEDVVRGDAQLGDCVVLMRQKMEAILEAAGLNAPRPKKGSENP
ncbi:MAG: [Fe-Fe] hydrogenase large subunit C-terminal domain-containing protein [Oscillospiraceae bacterium]